MLGRNGGGPRLRGRRRLCLMWSDVMRKQVTDTGAKSDPRGGNEKVQVCSACKINKAGDQPRGQLQGAGGR